MCKKKTIRFMFVYNFHSLWQPDNVHHRYTYAYKQAGDHSGAILYYYIIIHNTNKQVKKTNKLSAPIYEYTYICVLYIVYYST